MRLAAATCLLVGALAACDRGGAPAAPGGRPTHEPAAAGAHDAAPAAPAGGRTWPADAPSPGAPCNTHDDCAVIHWDGPWPPDPCCDARLGFTPVSSVPEHSFAPTSTAVDLTVDRQTAD